MDLSWSHGRSDYVDGPMTISLLTPDDMERAVVEAGRGAFLDKMDLYKGYRQLWMDPLDWPFLLFRH